MSLLVLESGLQTTLQAAPRRGRRGLGIPASGPADQVGMAFANRLVANAAETPALEVTFGMASFRAESDLVIGLSGAICPLTIDGALQPFDTTLSLAAGQTLRLGAPLDGMRSYLAVAGGFRAPPVFGSASTYLSGGFGGIDGRSLHEGDRLATGDAPSSLPRLTTPTALRQPLSETFVLRVVPSAEFPILTPDGRREIFEGPYRAAQQVDRMGVRLTGPEPEMREGAAGMVSGPVFPGTVQCPEHGTPIILGPDAQTTGGYPRLLSVIAADLPLLGQVRPGARIHFFYREAEEGRRDNRIRQGLLRSWVDLTF